MIGFLIKLILLAVFNISFFTVTKASCSFSMWLSYGFIHFSFLMFFIAPLFIKKSKISYHVAIESISLVTAIYFVAALFLGIFFLFNPLLTLFQYSIESIITGIYLVFLIVTAAVSNNIAKNENSLSEEKRVLDNMYVKAEFIKMKKTGENLMTKIDFLQEDIKYSPLKSNENVYQFENQILSILDEITMSIEELSDSDIESRIENCRNLLKQRNMLLRKNP